MEEYVRLLVLAYFRNHLGKYSLSELREMIGISFVQLDYILEQMISDGELFFEDAKLRISFTGRLFLMNSSMEGYKEVPDGEVGKCLLDEPWPIDKPFYVKKFSEKKWRDS